MKQFFQLNVKRMTPAQIIVAFYLLAVSVSVLLLSLPIAHKPGIKVNFIDILFTAASAVSVTGLGTINVADTFSVTGIYFLAFILQFGGIGVMTLGTFFWLLFGKKIGLKERQLIMTDQNQTKLSGLVNMLRHILGLILLIELFGFLILGTYYLNYYPTWQEAYLQGFFAAVSATTNAGVDITGQSLIPFAHDYFVQFINIVLIILGAIGFPVLIEVKDFLFSKEKWKNNYRFSLFTKLTSLTYFLLLIFGTIAILLFEMNHYFKGKAWYESFFYALFHSVSSRNAGLTTMNISDFSTPTLLILCALMFIGASPSSVGGGIRTTTFAVNIVVLFNFARGKKNIKLFKRELHEDDILKSFVVSTMAMVIVFISVLLLSITERFSLLEILFEVCSAFGTTGLSMGITPDLSTTGKIIIILLMFIGRIGILTFLFIIGKKGIEPNFHYPKERLIIG